MSLALYEPNDNLFVLLRQNGKLPGAIFGRPFDKKPTLNPFTVICLTERSSLTLVKHYPNDTCVDEYNKRQVWEIVLDVVRCNYNLASLHESFMYVTAYLHLYKMGLSPLVGEPCPSSNIVFVTKEYLFFCRDGSTPMDDLDTINMLSSLAEEKKKSLAVCLVTNAAVDLLQLSMYSNPADLQHDFSLSEK
ncbi:hypothetical protein P9112_013851 [Eukaryota sp. TZLM1-RC]